jgi:hypothetical protein
VFARQRILHHHRHVRGSWCWLALAERLSLFSESQRDFFSTGINVKIEPPTLARILKSARCRL